MKKVKLDTLEDCLRVSLQLHKDSCMSSFTALVATCLEKDPHMVARVFAETMSGNEMVRYSRAVDSYPETVGWLNEKQGESMRIRLK